MLAWIQALFGDAPWVPVLLWVITIIIVVFWFGRTIRKLWPAITQFVLITNDLGDLHAFMERTDTRLEGIYHETHKNDGSSIKDATVRSENAIERVELGVRGMYEKFDVIEDRLNRLEQLTTKPKE